MRKLILVGIIGLLLVGCGDKKIDINEDYLSGKWDCQVTTHFAEIGDGVFLEYGKPKFEDELLSFRFDGDKIYSGNSKDGWNWLLNVDWVNKETTVNYDEYTVRTSKFFENVSDNKFTYLSETESRGEEISKKYPLTYKVKSKYICTRIN